jgi:anti-sigma regulatory factor (Ser/Thr protein kinase)
VRPTGDWAGDSFCHEACCYLDAGELRERLVPFVVEGLERDEPVAVVVGPTALDLLADALGGDTRRLAVLQSAQSWWRAGGQRGHGCVREWDLALRSLQRTGRPFRVVGEPVWLGEGSRRWSSYEAVGNRSWADLTCYCLCLHDRSRLDGSVLDEVARTHPFTWDRRQAAPVRSDAYQDPREFVLATQPRWRERPARAAVQEVDDPRSARRALEAAVPSAWSARADDVVLAAHELVINALREVGVAELATWVEHEEEDGRRAVLVVEVADRGPGLADPLRGYRMPGSDPEGGRGMWVAWGLADDVSVGEAPGTRVRLFFRRP